VSAPSYTTYNIVGVSNEQGMVYYFKRVDGLNGQYSSFWASYVYQTEEAGCRHGDTLGFSQRYNKILIASPFCHNFDSNGTEKRLSGRVHFFSVSYD
ncbi:MAG: hypothetical protein ACKO96_46640, partial [Flammeovirgaceae bacterium]